MLYESEKLLYSILRKFNSISIKVELKFTEKYEHYTKYSNWPQAIFTYTHTQTERAQNWKSKFIWSGRKTLETKKILRMKNTHYKRYLIGIT